MAPRQRTIMIIYVIQVTGFDITTMHPPLTHYIERERASLVIRQLGWDYWIWGFESLKDFQSDHRDMDELGDGELWTLQVPEQEVRWCNLARLEKGRKPVWSWFYPDPNLIRKAGDIPMALVKAPINPTWISKRGSARDALISSGLWQESYKT